MIHTWTGPLGIVIPGNLFPSDGFDDRPPFFALAQGLAAQYVPALAPPQVTAIPDDPKVTALLKSVLHDTATGTIEPTLFTPAFRAQQFPAGMAQFGKNLAALGPLTSLTLVAQQAGGVLRSFRCRAVFGTTPMQCLFALDKNGKVATFGVGPE